MDTAAILQSIPKLRVGVIGDFCLDVYWHADMRLSELSRETPHFPLPIVEERLSPGGAGNVAANLRALRPASVPCVGLVGKDWRGTALLETLEAIGCDTTALLPSYARVTNTYIKPLRKGMTDVVYEDPRLDFTNYTPTSPEDEERLLHALEQLAPELDILCVCDQMPFGCITPPIRQRITVLGKAGLTVVVDSRDHIADYHHVIIKPNAIEACRAVNSPVTTELAPLMQAATSLERLTSRPVIITNGDQGCVVCENSVSTHIPAVKVTGEIDICGAGDTFLSAFACAIGAGASLLEAAQLGCRASAITIRKLKMTGTASPEEILNER
ncbi:MAG: bifunctional hydroxymethylpyrimidine kinase/phosphomethylpyrimidine kinase [Victivallales bacterium]|nr:bifunctional hydroxymethylpyrimidine kinase/phosphomethylpyrimidine kinase [Victivallales bacterium]